MLRKLVLAASAAALMGAAFFGASWARASSSAPPNLPSSLPASDLPTVQVPRADVLAINNIISAEDAARYGITPGSFTTGPRAPGARAESAAACERRTFCGSRRYAL